MLTVWGYVTMINQTRYTYFSESSDKIEAMLLCEGVNATLASVDGPQSEDEILRFVELFNQYMGIYAEKTLTQDMFWTEGE